MKTVLAALLVALALGCEISPVVSAPEQPGSRYQDCDKAAEGYCEFTIKASEREMDACVAEHRFRCVSSGALWRPARRS